ncbi:MAG TPA: superoxide dismutase [Salinivirga sp.]|uniref:superoxide dismutase n=1 Tax=Salinivirga sp. TaxID=1970192 RepID=UPI002B458F7B|nr:superoxide dismutase [Salinivirga sp.]HKK59438.1 superoxide dismutase [Salinivirga sp.]
MKIFGILFLAIAFLSCNQTTVKEEVKEVQKKIDEPKGEMVNFIEKLPEYAWVYPFELPELDYEYDALEPIIDAVTMETHHSKHHNGYTKKTNKAFEDNGLQEMPVVKVFTEITKYPDFVRNNSGGFYNHNLFWTFLTPGGSEFKGEVADAIVNEFQTKEAFMEQFEKAAATQFGSGWAWLVLKSNGKLAITQSANQNNPLMPDAKVQGIPLLNLDVWEHAYYLEYKNKRTEYISNFWQIVNWETVNDRYLMAKEVTQTL